VIKLPTLKVGWAKFKTHENSSINVIKLPTLQILLFKINHINMNNPPETSINFNTINREEKTTQLYNTLRTGQKALADWNGGSLAISAVPGAGKSYGMAVAAALLIDRENLNNRKQIIICTFTRAAAANIKDKINKFLGELGRYNQGFAVYTIHSLALSIAMKYSQYSGLDLDSFTLVSPTSSHRLIRQTVENWISFNPEKYHKLIEGNKVNFDGEETEILRRQTVLRTEILPQVAHTMIREAKSSGLTPEKLWEIAANMTDDYNILAISAGLYKQYQKLLKAENYLDYDDMILGALKVLKNREIRELYQEQFYAIFEDEAQDSSPLQEKLLKILAGNSMTYDLNLVRVGDPNQAINSTFTSADPQYFREFCADCEAQDRLAKMQQAGRSASIIIDAANFTLKWGNDYVKKEQQNQVYIGENVFLEQDIKPVNIDDPQANPAQVGKGLEIYHPEDIYASVQLIKQRVIELFTVNPESNAAILVRENRQAQFLYEQLKHDQDLKKYVEIPELSQSDRNSDIPQEMLSILQFLARPHSPDYLKNALDVMMKRCEILAQDTSKLVQKPEQFLYPGPLVPELDERAKNAQHFCCSLLQAKMELPIYHLISFIAMSLKYNSSELATAEKLAQRVSTNENYALKNTLNTLQEIVKSENFEPVETEETKENEEKYMKKKQLRIITMHKAKGLEWDYVFIPFLHKDIIPGGPYVPEGHKFLGDFNLAEVGRVQIRAFLHQQINIPDVKVAKKKSEYLKMGEELRLLYVAMTRAKKLLWMGAEKKAPFKWNIFDMTKGGNLQDKTASPILDELKQEFPQCICHIKSVM
jgi:DNA helicase II / ATP-dependent DNA helicase PcrA